ncbi:MAG: DoxX family protein [Woeseiaceae bacterium]|nr:DoxX family protein [Woeseiaceae bacterium]
MQITQSHIYGAFLLRISLGVMFIAHGLLKVQVFTLPGTAQFFESVGFAGWLAYPVAILEVIGGALLIAGVATRTLSLLFIPILLGAVWVHAGNGWVFSAANGGWEYPAFLTVALIVQSLLGSGAYAFRFPQSATQVPQT